MYDEHGQLSGPMQLSAICRQLVICSCLLVCAVTPSRAQTPSPSPQTDIEKIKADAAKGDPAAEFKLGTAYLTGKGVSLNEKKAIEWYAESAEKNFADSQIALGQLFFFGSASVPKDYPKAAHWFLLAANQGRPIAQNALGALYEDGLGVDEDVGKAAKWYRKAAEQGDAKGQSNLGRLYTLGQGGVKEDLVEAYKWLTLSANQGEVTAQEWMFEYRNLFTAEDKKEGINRAREFKAARSSSSPVTAPASIVTSTPTPH